VTGIIGRPKAGFHVPGLIKAIQDFLGWDNATDAFLVGAGNLGSALLGYKGFEQHGLRIVAAFDADPDKVGSVIHGIQVLPLDKLQDLAVRMRIHMGVITVPAQQAQTVADTMIGAGIIAIWNFAPVCLDVPTGISIQNEDLSSGLAVLSVRLSKSLRPEPDPESEE
jgi:redox-sensing transcriptional repressor